MRRIRTHMVGVEQGSTILFSDFEHDGEMWTGNGARQLVIPVGFSDRFLSAPSVHVSVSMWDLDKRTNARADISAAAITETGFQIIFRTWGDTRVARMRVDWIAMGEVSNDEDWDV
ncbi:H-type lectin domain-containing protein [Aliiroseovarius sp. F47248L]|uniref:H-type lectin domain-containing protein n=1 Tax=Aliiroseovarius sp. F47248L TaxID=2926420 RepID=UPI001FF12D0E|nr:H-type lectin domain-containing protein [Aliiroseovarius sp. F47248L]MCK0139556.1 H-type lectin domain-containing protein [Aliiroseovarius sp. F47248L]